MVDRIRLMLDVNEKDFDKVRTMSYQYTPTCAQIEEVL